MMLNSPADDFSQTSLAAVAGTLDKLRYIAGLRQANGEYFHWGMARLHGEATASLAIGQAHTNVFLSVLRTPIRLLWEEAGNSAQTQGADPGEFVQHLLEKEDQLIPAELQGGARRHFNSVLLALCSLAGVRELKVGRGA
jgi:hypothetical protein